MKNYCKKAFSFSYKRFYFVEKFLFSFSIPFYPTFWLIRFRLLSGLLLLKYSFPSYPESFCKSFIIGRYKRLWKFVGKTAIKYLTSVILICREWSVKIILSVELWKILWVFFGIFYFFFIKAGNILVFRFSQSFFQLWKLFHLSPSFTIRLFNFMHAKNSNSNKKFAIRDLRMFYQKDFLKFKDFLVCERFFCVFEFL